eukprot:TRINITY_DN13977_c0_g1_i3.p1 TRINITY_DN13977_c0_g1~~TRINITY_DN13977_c0_g1_i3.p1  ORF type:complete len:141 (-),score=15.01 TRINITY_DN13977_c0_g1_i3:326-748(-)
MDSDRANPLLRNLTFVPVTLTHSPRAYQQGRSPASQDMIQPGMQFRQLHFQTSLPASRSAGGINRCFAFINFASPAHARAFKHMCEGILHVIPARNQVLWRSRMPIRHYVVHPPAQSGRGKMNIDQTASTDNNFERLHAY